MDRYVVEAECQNGHKQQITYEGLPLAWVEMQMGLLDGSSPLYKSPPGPDSVIGKCAQCGRPFTTRIVSE